MRGGSACQCADFPSLLSSPGRFSIFPRGPGWRFVSFFPSSPRCCAHSQLQLSSRTKGLLRRFPGCSASSALPGSARHPQPQLQDSGPALQPVVHFIRQCCCFLAWSALWGPWGKSHRASLYSSPGRPSCCPCCLPRVCWLLWYTGRNFFPLSSLMSGFAFSSTPEPRSLCLPTFHKSIRKNLERTVTPSPPWVRVRATEELMDLQKLSEMLFKDLGLSRYSEEAVLNKRAAFAELFGKTPPPQLKLKPCSSEFSPACSLPC